MEREQKVDLIKICITIVMLIVLHFVPVYGNSRLFLYLVPYLVIGYENILEVVDGIRHGEVFDENFLMTIATIGAFVLATIEKSGDYNEAVFVMLFFHIGEFFEDFAVDRSRDNITELMDLRPDRANVFTEGEVKTISPENVAIGSLIYVYPGEKIPIDGVVEEGSSCVNKSMLTGEARPESVEVGEEVLSGCINETGLLKIRTTKDFGQSTASKILELVENAGENKAKSENFITKFARFYTPAVCILAAVLAFGVPLFRLAFGQSADFKIFLYRALIFLVISCPCALVISIPLGFFAGIGSAGKEGVLIKGSNYIEMLSRVSTVVFDKTGTLTKGVFEVTKINVADAAENEDKLLEIAAYAESFSSHPIALGIMKAYGKNIQKDLVSDIREIAGKGISAGVFGKACLVGNEKLMKENGIDVPDIRDSTAGTRVYVAVGQKYAGMIEIADVIKENAASSIVSLEKDCGALAIMLTGDEENTAEAVAKELGIKKYYSGLLPQDKVTRLEEILKSVRKPEREKVAFVGDGINDAPVIMRADVGIAMGALGSDAAIEAADVILMDDDPEKIGRAIKISRKCMRIVYENIVFAIGVKVICLILGAAGFASMQLAIFADVGVMVLAVGNSIRTLVLDSRFKRNI